MIFCRGKPKSSKKTRVEFANSSSLNKAAASSASALNENVNATDIPNLVSPTKSSGNPAGPDVDEDEKLFQLWEEWKALNLNDTRPTPITKDIMKMKSFSKEELDVIKEDSEVSASISPLIFCWTKMYFAECTSMY